MSEFTSAGPDFFSKHIGVLKAILQWKHKDLPASLEMKYETIPLPQGTEMFWVDCHTNVNFSPPCFLAVVTKQGGLMVRDVNWWPEPLEGNWIPIWDPRNTYEDLS